MAKAPVLLLELARGHLVCNVWHKDKFLGSASTRQCISPSCCEQGICALIGMLRTVILSHAKPSSSLSICLARATRPAFLLGSGERWGSPFSRLVLQAFPSVQCRLARVEVIGVVGEGAASPPLGPVSSVRGLHRIQRSPSSSSFLSSPFLPSLFTRLTAIWFSAQR